MWQWGYQRGVVRIHQLARALLELRRRVGQEAGLRRKGILYAAGRVAPAHAVRGCHGNGTLQLPRLVDELCLQTHQEVSERQIYCKIIRLMVRK